MKLTSQEINRLRQLMDACRAGSDDLSLPEMADLATALREDAVLRSEWERGQRTDRILGGAMHDVSAPAGLAERILAAAAARTTERLAGASQQAIAAEADADAKVASAPSSQPGRTLNRRHFWQVAGTIAAVLVAAVGLWQFVFKSPQKVTKAQLESSALAWFDAAIAQSGSARPATDASAVPFPRQAVKLPLRSWWPVKKVDERSLVVFDLTDPRYSGRVFLFAARTSKQYEVASVPFTRLNASRGLEIGAWQQGDVIYVLVLDSQDHRLRLDNVLPKPRLAYVPPGR